MASNVHIEPATAAHARELAPHMRPEDAAEELASTGLTPLETLERSIAASELCFAGRFDGELAAIWGVARAPGSPEDRPVGIIWALSGSAVERHKKAYVRESRRALALARTRYALLINWVDTRYERALRWARALGFTIQPPAPFGRDQRPFSLISIRSADHG